MNFGVMLQYLYPHGLLTWLMYQATRVRFAPWKNWQIRWFIGRYGVNMAEAAETDSQRYEHFNAFFTRALKASARPLQGDDDTIVSPADGTVSQVGSLQGDTLLQAKGKHYSVQALLGGDPGRSAPFENGRFLTVYLSPRDYHRVHMPISATLREMVYVPGRLFSVSAATTSIVPGLFARNERVVFLFESGFGPMALVMVGAMMVAGIETVWSGPVTPPHGGALRRWHYNDADSPRVALARGDELARFNMGSTVVLLLPAGRAAWETGLAANSPIRFGQAVARKSGEGGGGSVAEG
jgi:phosphatidylserine decarboxylase